ncbi:AmpD protein [Natronospira proteinivora]|uniref:1,6-anhydro-N-acetylmuramyl-L-alanine amidase AmpD n=1 Tax=Natronospira proteinivora TaxID=1807133 RepID=A0ABT1GAW0_9GAMM|nr:AmpD protein [Natronospira proteinivora]
MKFIPSIQAGWLDGARRQPSPNWDARPPDCEPSLLVIHCISLPPGEFGGPWIDHLFTNTLPPDEHPYFAEIQHMRVSSHLLIRRDGGVVQYVPFHGRAWHAGRSAFYGRRACNDIGIGIELEGCDDSGYTDAQYQQLAQATAAIVRRYPAITPERMTGHEHIAPGRKSDPGPGFAWFRFRNGVIQYLNGRSLSGDRRGKSVS